MRFILALLCALSLFISSPSVAKANDAIVLVAFGTSVPEALKSFEAIEKSYKEAYPNTEIVWAYTSDIIRKKLTKEGKKIFSVTQALDFCASKGFTDLRLQSLHITPSEEYSMLQRMIVRKLTKNPDQFKHLFLGQPLLESARDLDEVIDAVLKEAAQYRKKGEALLLMAHGNDRGPGDLVIARVKDAFHEKDPLVYVASVEGANSVEKVLQALKKKKVKTVHLAPLMLVAGDHARNDLAGDEADSWASQIRAKAMRPVPQLQGLGENAGIRAIYLRHTKDTRDDLAHPTKSDD